MRRVTTKTNPPKVKTLKSTPKSALKATIAKTSAVARTPQAEAVSVTPPKKRSTSARLKTPRRISSTQHKELPQLTHDHIQFRAWEIWQREGCPNGRDLEHWLLAEQELRHEAFPG